MVCFRMHEMNKLFYNEASLLISFDMKQSSLCGLAMPAFTNKNARGHFTFLESSEKC